MKFKVIIFPVLFVCGWFGIALYQELSVCNGEEDRYKMEVHGKLARKYLSRNTHRNLIFYSGKDSIYLGDPGGALWGYISLGDSLYKAPYSDTCTIYTLSEFPAFDNIFTKVEVANYNWMRTVALDDDCRCPANEKIRIRRELDSLRNLNKQ